LDVSFSSLTWTIKETFVVVLIEFRASQTQK